MLVIIKGVVKNLQPMISTKYSVSIFKWQMFQTENSGEAEAEEDGNEVISDREDEESNSEDSSDDSDCSDDDE